MNTDVTAQKIERLVRSLNMVRKYSWSWDVMITIALIAFMSTTLALLSYVVISYLDFLTITPELGSVPLYGGYMNGSGASITLLVPLLLIYLGGTLFARRTYSKALKQNFAEIKFDSQSEGIFGIIRIIQDYDLDSLQHDIRYARLYYVSIIVLRIAFWWVIAFALLYAFFFFIAFFIGFFTPVWAIAIVSVMVALVIRRQKFGEDAGVMWYLEYLLWDMRSLYTEFEEHELQA